METMESLRCLPESKRVFCYTCSELLLSTAVSPVHETHDLRYGIEDSLLVQPTKLLTPQDDRKSNAVSFMDTVLMEFDECFYVHTLT